MTTSEIRQWIDNDEGLYNWWKGTRLPKDDFIKLYRAELRRKIYDMLHKKPIS